MDHLGVLLHRERTTGLRLPSVTLVVVVLGVHDNLLRDQVRGIETDAKLPDHRNVRARGERLHERLGPRSRDRTEIVHQIGLGHTDAAIDDGERVVRLIRNDVNEELRLRLELGLIRQTFETNLIERIGRVTARK